MGHELNFDYLEDLEMGVFKPFAHYDRFMDCIRVYTHDRSITEQRIDETITIFRCNHQTAFDPKYVGFSLKGVNHALKQAGLSMDRAYKLAELIDLLVKRKPGQFNYALLEMTFENYKANGDLVVDFRDQNHIAA